MRNIFQSDLFDGLVDRKVAQPGKRAQNNPTTWGSFIKGISAFSGDLAKG
ncbi:hypothetical protein J43TS9_26030 [Paenibacillus cineris]|nr:hypothetical protein J43TS9_26030 [Paenibacillus cineris]